ncbi:cysteine-rich and transmembrane domain-containing protein WIH1-like [Prunus dulcis]|uniref:cysteine-rich and transmembrane domain-containing protein WIH1-like n=1 Tax=Prunus dulcis TaxID=3755 RepID=UPI001482679B|nr:cysteine-rich and transmembrane domain-containing protein WIH1-like [Prunus dulcis]
MSSATTQTTVAHPAPYYVQAPAPPAGYPTRNDQNLPPAAHGPKYYSKMSSSTNSGAAYPPPPCSTTPGQAPPPAGYPTRDAPNPHGHGAVETKSKGDGFWKGCCAALCCCCALDACF